MTVRLSLTWTLAWAAAMTGVPASADVSSEKPAASVRDLRDYFAACFHPPSLAANTRVTFYFSLTRRGGVIGQPRTTLLGFTGAEPEKERDLSQFQAAFDRCLPVSLDREMADTIPGEVYYLQYVVGPGGREAQVLFRPFGSHGGIGPALIPSVGPFVEPGTASLPARPSRAFRPEPGRGPFFHPPIVLPFHGGQAGRR